MILFGNIILGGNTSVWHPRERLRRGNKSWFWGMGPFAIPDARDHFPFDDFKVYGGQQQQSIIFGKTFTHLFKLTGTDLPSVANKLDMLFNRLAQRGESLSGVFVI